MSSLSFSSAARLGGERDNFISGSNILIREQILGSCLRKCLFYGIGGATNKRRLSVSAAKIRKGKKHDYPWLKFIDPNIKSGHLSYLSQFKPLTQKPKPVTLAFEKPLVDLEKKITDVRKMAAETGLDFSDQINLLESKYQQAVKDLYSKLTPFQRLHMARHPNRPTFLDHILNITDKWVELHGDRAGYDDPAIVTGLGSIDGKTFMFIGHQKGRNTKENIKRNFGMPIPHGYRKALRMMRYADHHGFPIITFVDTPGAFADLKSEELGQGEAIAFNLREMFGLKVPMVSVVIGEGGSGGALAICCANKLLMLENSVFYVASPEACAAILWKDSQASPKAAERLRITPKALQRLKIADGIIPEPLGGAHLNPTWTSQQIKIAVMNAMEELSELDNDSLLHQRYMKYRILGGFDESKLVDPVKKSRMKKKDMNMIPVEKSLAEDVNTLVTDGGQIKIEDLKKRAREGKILPVSAETITKVRQEVDKELANAFISMGLHEELESLKTELSRSPETIDPALKERANRLVQEFKQKFDCPESFLQLKEKLKVLSWVIMLQKQILEKKRSQMENEKVEKLKGEINEKLLDKMKAKMEVLRTAQTLVASGMLLDADQIEAVEAAKDELIELLKSVNLELVGLGTTKSSTTPPGLEAELTKVDDVVMKEIDMAVEKAGLRCKIEELKAEIASGSNEEKIEQLVSDIREEIAAAIDLTELRKRVEASVGSFIQEPAYAGCVKLAAVSYET